MHQKYCKNIRKLNPSSPFLHSQNMRESSQSNQPSAIAGFAYEKQCVSATALLVNTINMSNGFVNALFGNQGNGASTKTTAAHT